MVFLVTNFWLDVAFKGVKGRNRPELLNSESGPLDLIKLHFPCCPCCRRPSQGKLRDRFDTAVHRSRLFRASRGHRPMLRLRDAEQAALAVLELPWEAELANANNIASMRWFDAPV